MSRKKFVAACAAVSGALGLVVYGMAPAHATDETSCQQHDVVHIHYDFGLAKCYASAGIYRFRLGNVSSISSGNNVVDLNVLGPDDSHNIHVRLGKWQTRNVANEYFGHTPDKRLGPINAATVLTIF